MAEIFRFNIEQAYAKRSSDGAVTVQLHYPNNPQILTSRAPENLDFGVQIFNQLLTESTARLGNSTFPFIPPSAGSAFVTEDHHILVHRRDLGARVNKMYHSINAGYPSSFAEVSTEEGLISLALRESAEETLLITTDKKPWLIVPADSKEITLESAKRIGLDLKIREVKVETMAGDDTLEVFYDEKPIFRTNCFIDFGYNSCTYLNALFLRRFSLSSEEVISIDGEGMHQGDKYQRFNREAYILSLNDLSGKKFGDSLNAPRVYQADIFDGSPVIQQPSYQRPFYGPNGVEVNDPHTFAPDDLLVRMLDALGVEGYKGKWLEIERWKETTRLSGHNLLSETAKSSYPYIDLCVI